MGPTKQIKLNGEMETLKQCMDTWQQSSRCCKAGCKPDRCGLVVMNLKNSGHCRNALFEMCEDHGGDGHENLIKTWTAGQPSNCALIYGYSIKNGELRLNSGTLNGNAMPQAMKDVLPKVFNG